MIDRHRCPVGVVPATHVKKRWRETGARYVAVRLLRGVSEAP